MRSESVSPRRRRSTSRSSLESPERFSRRYRRRSPSFDRRELRPTRKRYFDRKLSESPRRRHVASTLRRDGIESSTYWRERRERRERALTPGGLWASSPSPPRRLADRLEVGGDERRRRERERQKKAERRARKQLKRARRDKDARAESSVDTVPRFTPGKTGANDHHSSSYVKMNIASDTKNDTIGQDIRPLASSGTFNPARSNLSHVEEDEEEDAIGPILPPPIRDAAARDRGMDYGKALRSGEGAKIAAFVQEGVRIPRRGEIGLTSDEIAGFESQGYVMSGSRNRRMEAVRIRKENQVYSAEELAALSQFSREERKLREEKVLNQFRTLVESKLNTAKEPDLNDGNS